MINSAISRAGHSQFSGLDLRGAVWTSVAIVVVALFVTPIANWQLAAPGMGVVAAAALTMIVAVILSVLAGRTFGRGPLTAMLVPMAIRMFLPLVFVLVIVAAKHPALPAWSAMYVAPIYFAALITETGLLLQQCRLNPSGHDQDSHSGAASLAR